MNFATFQVLTFLLVMPKYEGKQNFSFLSIPKAGEKQRAEEARKQLFTYSY